MNILFLNPNQIGKRNWGHQLFKNEFAKHHNVVYYGKGFPNFNSKLTVPQIIKRAEVPFDMILTYQIKYCVDFLGLGEIKNIPKVHIQVDFKGRKRRKMRLRLFRRNKYDVIFVVTTAHLEALQAALKMDKMYLLPFSVDINKYKDLGLKRDVDVMAMFTAGKAIYPTRLKIQQLVKKLGVKSFVARQRKGKYEFVHDAYIKLLNRAKIFVHGNNSYGDLNMKYSEVLACNTLFLTDRPVDFERVGFVDGEHLVLYKNLEDLRGKITYYLAHEAERVRIAKQGMEFVRKYHSCGARVKQFTKIIQEVL